MTDPYGDLSSPALPGNSGPAMLDPSGKFWMCSQCHTSGGSKMFHSRQAANGHMQVHTKRAKLQAEGRKKKRKEEVPYASGMSQSRSPSGKQSKSHQASFGPMRVDNNQPQRQVQQVHEEKEKEPARNFLKFGQCNSNKMKGNGSAMAEGGASLSEEEAGRKKIHLKFDLNKDAPEDDERETKGDGSAVAEGGASLSEEEAGRKKTHMKFDLSKDAPEDDENDDEEGA